MIRRREGGRGKDPIGFDGGDTDLYSYAWCDPVNYLDPFGENSTDVMRNLLPLWGGALLEPTFIGEILATAATVTALGYLWEANKDANYCSAERSSNSPAKRKRYPSKKDAREAAQRAGKGKEPIHHPDGEHGPHYHPDVPMPKQPTPKMPNPHDHYYYP